jgi:hypothetical protein
MTGLSRSHGIIAKESTSEALIGHDKRQSDRGDHQCLNREEGDRCVYMRIMSGKSFKQFMVSYLIPDFGKS